MKKILIRICSLLGFEIRNKGSAQRMSMAGVLRHAKKLGFRPATVIDIGAAFGDWTVTAASIFPEAHYIIAEPLTEYRGILELVRRSLGSSQLFLGAVAKPGITQLSINVHKDLVGSSIFKEVEDEHTLIKEKRVVPASALDALYRDRTGSCLLKIDIQGAELEALKGGANVLNASDMVILEVSLFRSVKSAPLFDEVISFMENKGFVVYDIASISYRPLDGALCQTDIVFVKERGLFRTYEAYATPAQREQQNKKFAAHSARRLGP